MREIQNSEPGTKDQPREVGLDELMEMDSYELDVREVGPDLYDVYAQSEDDSGEYLETVQLNNPLVD